jgi:glycosyltransferase involved in cell wall biosynthesis
MVSPPTHGARMLVLALAGSKPPDEEMRRLMAEDAIPNAILAEDALDATSLNDRDLAELPGLRGRVLRRLPIPIALALEAWGKRRDYDAVLTWGERLAFPLAVLLSLTRRPRMGQIAILMWPFDTSSPSRVKRVIRSTIFPLLARHGIDRVFVPSPYQRELVIERWRIPTERIVNANWSVDTGFWRPAGGAGDTICSVGREMRDYETLIAALRTLDIPCHIAAGTGSMNKAHATDDPRATNLDSEPLPGNVTIGYKTALELRDLYRRSRVVVVPVMPSECDNGTTTIAEAMAMGRAVITTATTGRARILEDGVNCVLVPERDPAALRAAIEELWNDPDRCARLGANGRERIVPEHGLEQWLTAVRGAASELARRRTT